MLSIIMIRLQGQSRLRFAATFPTPLRGPIAQGDVSKAFCAGSGQSILFVELGLLVDL